MQKYVCSICGYVYDEAVEKVKFQELPENWKCPLCSAPKSAFRAMPETGTAGTTAPQSTPGADAHSGIKGNAKQEDQHEDISDMKKLSAGELSALCSSLAKGCEKQYLAEESGLYMQLADYFKSKMSIPDESTFPELLELVNNNLSAQITEADNEAESASDRGAKRVLTWNRKVTTMLGA
ncbi:MAG: rubredoxin, partial [Clostridiales bacterium]|nr:rubredoxin [Clostridiales bacterium]